MSDEQWVRQYLWCAVHQEGNGLDFLIQPRRNQQAAKTCFRKLLQECQYMPLVLITDQFKGHSAAKRDGCPVWNIGNIAV
jgi:putative transposase